MRLAYYGDIISPNITKTPEGYLICKNVPIGRTGEMEYFRRELGLDGNPDEIVIVTRDESEVFDTATLASFEGKPVTNTHPTENVAPDNWAHYSRGHVENVRRGTGEDSNKMVADLFITDPTLISEVENNVQREVSCGYTCEYSALGDGSFSQRQIRGNHVAIVGEGRAGKSVCIKDSVETLKTKSERRTKLMSKKQNNLKSILGLFAGSVRDAKTSDEIEEATENAAEAIDCMAKGGEKPTAAPAVEKETKEKEETKDTAPTLSEEMLTAIKGAIAEAVSAELGKMNTVSKDAEKVEEKDTISELIKELEGKKDDKDCEVNTDNDPAEMEEAVTVEAETMDNDFDATNTASKKAMESAIAILKNARPAIAAIKNADERKRVTDALVQSVYGQLDNSKMTAIMKSATLAAKKNANDSKTAVSFDLEAQQAAYDKYNPHMRKKEER